jgi:hypothetical protein
MPTKAKPETATEKTAEKTAEMAEEAATAAAGESAKAASDASEGMRAAAEAVSDENVASVADEAIDGVTLTQQQALETFESAQQAMMEGVTRFQKELVDFVSERIRHDMETQQALLRCRSFDEVRDVQVTFLQTAMDQYSTEANKLMRLGSEVVQRSFDREA